MALLDPIAIVKFLTDLFGTEVFGVAGERLQGWVKRLFASQNILVLGPKATGKSSLVNFLIENTPYSVNKEGEKITPEPTGIGAIINKKASLHTGDWVKIKSDLPGDQGLRYTWKQSIHDFDPNGIIYMLNGQHLLLSGEVNQESVQASMDELFDDVLSYYEEGCGISRLFSFVSITKTAGPTR